VTAKRLIGHVAVALLGAVVDNAVAHTAPRFEPGSCPASVEQHERVACGWLVVPERRTRPTRREVRLAVAVIHPPAPVAGAEPLLYLTGGPGFASLLFNVLRFLAEPLVTDRDLVLVDLRGTGASLASLACPEVDEGALLAAPSRDVAARRRNLREVAACRARLRREGVDLAPQIRFRRSTRSPRSGSRRPAGRRG
jgi:pimeloyl-ACP methyl ester carboxylesterase